MGRCNCRSAANKAIATHHLHAVWSLTAAWRQRLVKVYAASYGEDYAEKASLPSLASFSSDPLYASLPASTVAALTYSKADTEAPTLALLQPSVHTVEDFGSWQKVTSGLPIEHLDASSLALLAAKHPRDWATPEATALGDAQLGKRVARFEARLTQEEFRNELMFHGAVHQRMAKPVRLDFASLNDFVYARLFHTPQSDAWLGLGATEALTAQADDGLVAAAAPVTPEAPVSAR
jgi:hypothetical protein